MVADLQPEWLYLSAILGIIGAVVIAIIGAHSMYHEQQGKIGSKLSRSLSIMFFTFSIASCIGFGLFKTNLILPMGPVISCRFGFFLCTNAVFLCKISLFCIFLYRIHMAFDASTLGYKTSFLIIILVAYICGILILNIAHIVLSRPLVHLKHASNQSVIGVCTTSFIGNDEQQTRLSVVIVAMFIGDVISSVFVCGLFVHKLRIVIKMVNPESETHGHRKYKMILLARKQTVLVIFACVSSLFAFGMAGIVAEIGYLVSVDLIVNAFCVWFMYSFTKNAWNIFVKYICCCCYCCVFKEEAIITMNSIKSRSKTDQDSVSPKSPNIEHKI